MKSYQASSLTKCYETRCQLQGKSVRNTNTWRVNNTFLNNQQLTEEIKKFLETTDNENMTTQNLWDAVKAVLKSKVYSNTFLPQETRKTLNRQPNFTRKTTGKEQQQQQKHQN